MKPSSLKKLRFKSGSLRIGAWFGLGLLNLLLLSCAAFAQGQAQVIYFSTLAGFAGQQNSDGTGTNAFFTLPAGAGVDSAGNVYVSDFSNNTIRKITPAGIVTTFAGSPGIAGSA
ncbi:MAG TPA: hypothetical protein VFB72_12010, partial [Verrucomicrobiae bacterium]|nr:hypothetical protein [Verrucomicrobiae bacterium]